MTYRRDETYMGLTQDAAWLVAQMEMIGAVSVEATLYDNSGTARVHLVADFAYTTTDQETPT